MKKITVLVVFLLCALLFELIVYSDDTPPIIPPRITLTPSTPKLKPLKELENVQFPNNPIQKNIKTEESSNREAHIVIGMYDNMLKMVQIKRYWPIETRYDSCVMLHNYNWICP